MTTLEIARRCKDEMYSSDRASKDLGIEVEIPAEGAATASFDIGEAMVNGLDVCHGGYVFTLADTAFAFACNAYDDMTYAAGASIEFLHPARLGDCLTATAIERHRGRRTGIYDVVVRNQENAKIAIFRGRSHSTGRPLLQPT